MVTVDNRKVNVPYGLGKTLRSAFPLFRWSSGCFPRYSGIPRLFHSSHNDIYFVMKLVDIILLILTACLYYFCKQKLHFHFKGFSQKCMFLPTSFTDIKNFRTILFRFLICCVRLLRFVSYVN